jgi:hypothetical protein
MPCGPNYQGVKHWLFPKGKSQNPGGRPPGLRAAVRSATKDGVEIVDFLLSVLRGQLPATASCEASTPVIEERLEAARMLLDRGWGKPQVSVDLSVEKVEVGPLDGVNLDLLDKGQREILDDLLLKATFGSGETVNGEVLDGAIVP